VGRGGLGQRRGALDPQGERAPAASQPQTAPARASNPSRVAVKKGRPPPPIVFAPCRRVCGPIDSTGPLDGRR
jgi:hypothetical protein